VDCRQTESYPDGLEEVEQISNEKSASRHHRTTDDADALDDYLQEPRMTVTIISDESLNNRRHRMSRQNGNPVIGLLRYRDTLIAE